MIAAILYIVINIVGYILAILKSPFWALVVYANIYFYPPISHMHWWMDYLPAIRWLYLTVLVTFISMVLHRNKLSKKKFSVVVWMLMFLIITVGITFTIAVNPSDSKYYTHMLFTYCVIVVFMTKILNNFESLRNFLFVIIVLVSTLSYKAFTSGKRIHDRLEGIGPADAVSSNEFGILLASVLPLLIPFLIRGKMYEKVICLIAMPFIINAFILCNSRGAFVSILIAIVFSFLLISNRVLKKYLIIMGICIVPLTIYLMDTAFIERSSSLLSIEDSNEESLNELSSGRVEIWMYGLKMAGDYPLGAGPEGFRNIARFYMPDEILTFHSGDRHGFRAGDTYGVRGAHNSYLQVLVEQGILGFGVFMFLCLNTIYILYLSVKKIESFGESTSFVGLFVLSMNISFFCSIIGGIFGAQVYFEFFWWQIAFSHIIYSLLIDCHDESSYNIEFKERLVQ